MRKSNLRTVGLAAMAALVCAGCTDVGDEGEKYIYGPVDKLLGLYMVKFEQGSHYGGGTIPRAMTVVPGESITLPSGDGLKDGEWVFGGWNTDSYGRGTNYNAGSTYKPTNSVTLYVKWIRTYMVLFYASDYGVTGVTGTVPETITADSGSSVTLPDGNGLTKEGYYFSGWRGQISGNSDVWLDAGSSYKLININCLGGCVVFYAQWRSMNWVDFSANGGDGTAPGRMYVIPGDSITLPNGSNLTRECCYFGEWNTNSNGTGTNYSVGSFYKPNNTTLYVKWNPKYSVEFKLNGGSGGTAPAAMLVIPGDSVSLPYGGNMTKEGYYFGGWNTQMDGYGTTFAGGSFYKPTGNIELYVKWNSQ